MNSRTRTVRILADVLDNGTTLDVALATGTTDLAERDRAFVQELCYGVLRWLPRLRFQLSQLLDRPLRDTDRDLEYLLLCGLYQLFELRTPDHAAVDASVDGTSELGKPWAGKLVNAVLRRAVRERAMLNDSVRAHPAAEYAHPKWLLKKLQRAWPDDWQAIATANNRRAPLCVRVHTGHTSLATYADRLRQAGLSGQPHPHAPEALLVEPAVAAEQLPDFQAGDVTIQDAAAQLAAGLLDLQPGQRVLDACAAPGGKTTHILEIEPGVAEVVALDVAAERLERVRGALQRLALTARLVCADAGKPSQWWDGRPFDRILLDAPCSGSGVIRRHPDIKYHRDSASVAAAAERQRNLLAAVWPLLARGGKLLYVTCSVLPEENTDIIDAFMRQHADARALPVAGDWGRPAGTGRQILPGDADMDGFFYACLGKK